MCLNDTRSSASTSSYGYDVKQADNFGPVCSLSLVDAIRHASMTRSVRRTVVVVGDVCWRLEEHTLAEEILSTDCTSQRSGVPFIYFFICQCMHLRRRGWKKCDLIVYQGAIHKE